MKAKKIWVILAIVVICMVAAVCIVLSCVNSPKRAFEKNLKAVAEYVFVMPDKYISDASAALEKGVKYAESLDLPEVTTGLDENVKQYFTDDAYEKFKTSWVTFSIFCVGTDYTTNVKSVKTEDYSDGQTKFTAILSYGKPNEEAIELAVWGRARSNDEGKIEFWQLMEDPQHALAKLNN